MSTAPCPQPITSGTADTRGKCCALSPGLKFPLRGSARRSSRRALTRVGDGSVLRARWWLRHPRALVRPARTLRVRSGPQRGWIRCARNQLRRL